MYDTQHPAYKELQEIGKEVTGKVKPKAVVIFSAHWQGGKDVVEVNTSEVTELIYDFYNFPSHYYEEKYPNVGSKGVAEQVIEELTKAGIKTKAVSRGLDHGVWASFKCAFDPSENPLNVPIVQVSLFSSEDPDAHYALGRALSSLRTQNIQIVVSGMAVHNLRDAKLHGKDDRQPLPYTLSFDAALKDAATSDPGERQGKMAELLNRDDARKAHPTFEHLLPIFIGAGAAEEERGVRLFTLPERSLSWAMFRFGEVGA